MPDETNEINEPVGEVETESADPITPTESFDDEEKPIRVTFYPGSQTEAGPKVHWSDRQTLDAVITHSHFPRRKRVDLLVTDTNGVQFEETLVKLIGAEDKIPEAERFCVWNGPE